MAISSPLLEKPHIHLTPRLVVALLVAAVLATAAAFTVQSWAQKHLAASHTALILSAEPLFAWVTSLIFLHEGLSRHQSIGALLILAGMGLTEFFSPTAPVELAFSRLIERYEQDPPIRERLIHATHPPAHASKGLASGTTELRPNRPVRNEVDILRYWVESPGTSTEGMRYDLNEIHI
jgi:hypothetical protein